MEHVSARQHVIDMCRTMLERGYLKATEGNVSVRVPGRRLYAVTPSNYSYDRMRVEDVCIVDFDGQHVPDADRAAAALAPSIECGMHANIYRARPDVNAIVHTHQPYASALAVLRRPIPALTDEQVRFLGREVAIIDYAPSGTGLLARNVQKKITSGDNAFILANHGIVAVGTDPERAVFNMALLEKVSIAYLMALATESGKVHTIPTAIREIAFAKLRSDEKRIAAQITKSVPAQHDSDAVPLPSADAAASAVVAAREAFSVAEPAAALVPVEAPGAESARLGYAISSYPDVDDTMARLKALVDQPVRGLRHDALNDVLEWFETKCQGSKQLTDRAKSRIPGGVQHNLAFNHPFPLAIDRADGAHLTDRDGNVYIDFLQAGGPTLLGSNYGPVNDRVAEVVRESGPVTGLFHEYELKLAESIHHYMPHIEMYRSLGSGTEAVMAAVRAARAHTGHSVVIKVGGAYHGWSDTLVYGLRVPGTFRMNAKGIPFGATSATREAFPHDLKALRRKLIENRARGGTAAWCSSLSAPSRAPARPPKTSTPRCASCATSSGRCSSSTRSSPASGSGWAAPQATSASPPTSPCSARPSRAATRWPVASAAARTSWRSSAPASTGRAARTCRSAAPCRPTRCPAPPATSPSRRWPAPTPPSSPAAPATGSPRVAAAHRQARPALRRLQPGLDRPPRVQRRDAARHAQPGQAASRRTSPASG